MALQLIWHLLLLTSLALCDTYVLESVCPEHCKCFLIESKRFIDCSQHNLNENTTLVLENVNHLNLSLNNFTALKNGIVIDSHSKLEVMILSHNYIKDLQADFGNDLVSLKELDLSFNNIEEWHQIELRTLTKLNLSHNKIEKIASDAFQNLEFITNIDLSANYIKNLDSNMFGQLKNLKSLDLSLNELDSFLEFNSTSIEFLHLNAPNLELFYRNCTNDPLYTSLKILSAVKDLFLRYFTDNPGLKRLEMSANFNTTCSYTLQEVYDIHATLKKDESIIEYYSTLIIDSATQFSLTLVKSDADELSTAVKEISNIWRYTDGDIVATNISALVIGAVIGSCLTAILCRCANTGSNPPETTQNNIPPTQIGTTNQVVIRIPLRLEDENPPSYTEALAMRRSTGSIHSLPDYLDSRIERSRRTRRSRSVNDIIDHSESENNISTLP